MLGDGFGDVPGAGHAFGEGREVSLLDRDRLSSRGRHGDPVLDDVAGLGLAVGPGKLGNPAAPGRPAANAQLGDVCLGGLSHGNGGHPQHEGGGLRQEQTQREQRPPHRTQRYIHNRVSLEFASWGETAYGYGLRNKEKEEKMCKVRSTMYVHPSTSFATMSLNEK